MVNCTVMISAIIKRWVSILRVIHVRNQPVDEVKEVDKNEYKVKSEKMLELMDRGAFSKAANVADSIEWNKVKNISMLSSVSEIYEKNNELEKSYRILNIAYQRSDGSRKIIYRLCSLALKTGNLDEALDFYDDFMEIAPKDPNQYILRYQILRARKAPVEQQIEALEHYKQEEYVEEWAYELAKLYDEAGMTAECLNECDDIMLWFSEGKYVYQAMDLKKKYKPLTAVQQERYDRRFEKPQRERNILPKEKNLGTPEERSKKGGGARKAKDKKKASDPNALPPELKKILPFPDKPIGVSKELTPIGKELGEQSKEVSILADENIEVLGEEVGNLEEANQKIGKTMDLGDALQSLLNEEVAKQKEEEAEYVLDTGSMEEAIMAIEALADLPLAKDYGKEESQLADHAEGKLSLEDILNSMTEYSKDTSKTIETMGADMFVSPEAVPEPIKANEERTSLDPDIQRMIDEIEGNETPPHSVEDVVPEELIKKMEKVEAIVEPERIEKVEKEEVELEFDEITIELEEDNQEEEETQKEEVMELEEEIVLGEAMDLEDSLFEDSATSANKFIQEEFKLQDSHLEEEDERFVKEKKKRKKPVRKDGLPRTTAPLSRKETAKLHATGKTAPLPTGELSDAISLQDSGFLVQGRYDLESQSGKGLRAGLTEEQKKLFSYFVPVRGMSEQLVDVLEQDRNINRGGTSRTGNLLIIGQKGSGKTVLAVDVVKAIQKQRNVRQGKVAILTGDALNKKKIQDIVSKLYGGALIIEKAGKMSEKTIVRLNKAMEQETGELLIVLEDQRKPLDRMLSMNREFKKKFTSRLEVPVFINDELVTFGQAYAQENGYRIDEMGILALYSKIDARQREDHAVTVAEVKVMMDEAIDHSQRTSAGKLVKRVLGKNTDEADRIILSEKDFTE